jgi:hypothetical protein
VACSHHIAGADVRVILRYSIARVGLVVGASLAFLAFATWLIASDPPNLLSAIAYGSMLVIGFTPLTLEFVPIVRRLLSGDDAALVVEPDGVIIVPAKGIAFNFRDVENVQYLRHGLSGVTQTVKFVFRDNDRIRDTKIHFAYLRGPKAVNIDRLRNALGGRLGRGTAVAG